MNEYFKKLREAYKVCFDHKNGFIYFMLGTFGLVAGLYLAIGLSIEFIEFEGMSFADIRTVMVMVLFINLPLLVQKFTKED